MRESLNKNPVVQVAVLGVLLVVVGLLFATRVLKHDAGAGATTTTTASSASVAPAIGSSTGAPASPAATGVTPTASAAAATGVGAAPPPATSAFKAGPGLPAPVVNAWDHGNAIVLLIVRGGGIDDRLVRSSVDALGAVSGVSVFVARAGHVARYSRITQGVGVDRAPALIVVRPKRLSGGVPQALVSYGFRDKASVIQAVKDALYSGRDDIPYYP